MNFYVDKLLDSFYTEEEASQVVKDFTALLKNTVLHLNQWIYSFRRVLSLVSEGCRNQSRLNLHLEDIQTERTLGALYDSGSDNFIFDVKPDFEASTKRRILSALSSLYDLLGFLSTVTLSAKRMLQELLLEALELITWCESRSLFLKAIYLPDYLNVIADLEFREKTEAID